MTASSAPPAPSDHEDGDPVRPGRPTFDPARWRAGAAGWWHEQVSAVREAWGDRLVRYGFWACCLIVAGSMTPAFLPPDAPIVDTLHLGWLQEGPGRVLATLCVLGGVAILLDAWVRMRPRREGATVPAGAWMVWSLPLLVAPPLFSRDAFSYAAQGLVVSRGMDPYATGPISVPGAFADQVDRMWLYTPAPYGPLALQIQRLVTDLSFGNAYAAALGMRIPALLSMFVIAAVLPRIARRLGLSVAPVVWMGLLNPLVVLHVVGGMHNDAIMLALVLVGLYAALQGHLVAGALAVAAGAGVKQTAALALLGVAASIARRRAGGRTPDRRTYWSSLVRTGLVGLVGFTAVTFATGLGWGWMSNMSVPLSQRSWLAPFSFVGSTVEAVLRLVGADPSWYPVPLQVTAAAGAIVAVVAMVYLTFWVAPRHPMAATLGVFVAFVGCGPVLHPWYLLPVFMLVGLSPAGRRHFDAAVWVTVLVVAYAAFDVALGNGVWIAAFAVLAWAWSRRRRRLATASRAPSVGSQASAPDAGATGR